MFLCVQVAIRQVPLCTNKVHMIDSHNVEKFGGEHRQALHTPFCNLFVENLVCIGRMKMELIFACRIAGAAGAGAVDRVIDSRSGRNPILMRGKCKAFWRNLFVLCLFSGITKLWPHEVGVIRSIGH